MTDTPEKRDDVLTPVETGEQVVDTTDTPITADAEEKESQTETEIASEGDEDTADETTVEAEEKQSADNMTASFASAENSDSYSGFQTTETTTVDIGEKPTDMAYSFADEGDTETHGFSTSDTRTYDENFNQVSKNTSFEKTPQTEISQEDVDFFAKHPDGQFKSLSQIKKEEKELAEKNPYDLESANIIDENVFRTNYRDHKKKPFYLSDNYKRAWEHSFHKFMEANEPDEIVSSAILGVLKFMAELPKERLKYAREEQREENKYVKEKKKKYMDSVLYAKGISQDAFYKHMADVVYGDEGLIERLEKDYPKVMRSIPKDKNGIYDMSNLTKRQEEMLTHGIRKYAEGSPKLKEAIENIVGLRMSEADMKRYAIGLAGKHSQISRHQAIRKGLLKDVKSALAPKRDTVDAVDELRASVEALRNNMSDRDALRMARNKTRTKTGENTLSFDKMYEQKTQRSAG